MDRRDPQPSYSRATRDIRVTVVPQFIPEQSDRERGVYSFSYSVTFENLGLVSVQLINRHWKVYSGGVQIADVKGEGVVGDQPVIHPNDRYRYTSGSVIRDPYGGMEGTYTFISEKGEFFDVEIPRFDLIHLDDEVVH